MTIQYIKELPDKTAFHELYETTGWNRKYAFTEDDLAKALHNSYFLICAYHNGKLVGFGRLISDGIYQTFIGDMIVHPNFQKKGIGREILTGLIAKCRTDGMKWIQLTSAKGKMEFYRKFGFEERPTDAPGMQMYL